MKLVTLLRRAGLALIGSMWLAASALAGPWRITIDATPLSGQTGFLAFDFIAGSPASGNAALVSAFASNATLGTGAASGDVSGNLGPGGLTLRGGSFFNEWLQGVSAFGSSITFDLDLGDNAVAGGRPDQFAFFVLDSTQLPFATDDPSGAGALFAFDLVGGAATRPVAFNSNFARATVELRVINPGVPEPGTLLLVPLALAFALGVAGSARRRRRGRLGVAAL